MVNMRIYADHAATTRLDEDAFEAMKPFLLDEYGNPSQLYSFARTPKKALRQARNTIAACIGAQPEEIFFTSGGTESNNWAMKGMMIFQNEGVILTSSIEHHSVLRSCAALEQLRHPVAYLPVTRTGVISDESLRRYITCNTSLVSVMFANNEIGTIQPIQKLAAVTHRHGAVFHTDAVQAVGHVPIDVKEMGIDLLSASAHKFNGPRGVGFLYVHKAVQLTPYLDGGAQEKSLRAGTENLPAIVGMAAALEKSCETMSNRAKHLYTLEERLIQGLRECDLDFLRNGDERHLPGLISLSFRNADGEALLHRLDFMGICVSTGSACNSTETELSHVVQAIGVPEEYALGTIRISFGYENTLEDSDEIVRALRKILSPGR